MINTLIVTKNIQQLIVQEFPLSKMKLVLCPH